jgi:hypothetical protein
MTLAHSGVAFLDLVPKMAVGDEDESYRWCGSRCNEFEVGIRALSRSPSFHPGEDNIVRTYARMLRKRLEEYFETEGREAFGRTHIRWHRARASPGRGEHGGYAGSGGLCDERECDGTNPREVKAKGREHRALRTTARDAYGWSERPGGEGDRGTPWNLRFHRMKAA